MFRKRTPKVGGTPVLSAREVSRAEQHVKRWRQRLGRVTLTFTDADSENLRRATLVAASRGMFASQRGERNGVLLDALKSRE